MAESTVTADSKPTSSDTRRRIWAIVGPLQVIWSSGSISMSTRSVHSTSLTSFPSGNTTTQLLQTAGVFAAGFLMRPIGGWLFAVSS